ncbi:hypothetical protein [Kaistella yonginensis]|uniref:hypothetical protein n=1 Tax=Kaistella yonginensis TaxID=658267 RepID=UPI0025B39949|nr:hypothetical protein [Kaistella yonginensis]MDN3605847.1 hypothetical protein [Kaistella yonginensis]
MTKQKLQTESKIPVDNGTTVLFRETIKFGSLDATWESWIWEGVQAFSVIFKVDDINKYSDKKLLEMTKHIVKDSKPNISRNGQGFVFVNYGFSITK